mmetsp:Transcript_48212/g.88803  ORF Transcript_48212/g.88803 Transcript_48212/m.88803 type:complete len:537 (-) Transcript_48212:128-1738(-)
MQNFIPAGPMGRVQAPPLGPGMQVQQPGLQQQSPPLAVGDAVEAQCEGWGDSWFPGSIRELLPSGEVQVLWDGDEPSISNLRPGLVRKRAGAKPAAAVEQKPAEVPAALPPRPDAGTNHAPSQMGHAIGNGAVWMQQQQQPPPDGVLHTQPPQQQLGFDYGMAAGKGAVQQQPEVANQVQDSLNLVRPPPDPNAGTASLTRLYRYDFGPGDDITGPMANLRRRVEVELKGGYTIEVSLNILRPEGQHGSDASSQQPQAPQPSRINEQDGSVGSVVASQHVPAAGTMPMSSTAPASMTPPAQTQSQWQLPQQPGPCQQQPQQQGAQAGAPPRGPPPSGPPPSGPPPAGPPPPGPPLGMTPPSMGGQMQASTPMQPGAQPLLERPAAPQQSLQQQPPQQSQPQQQLPPQQQQQQQQCLGRVPPMMAKQPQQGVQMGNPSMQGQAMDGGMFQPGMMQQNQPSGHPPGGRVPMMAKQPQQVPHQMGNPPMQGHSMESGMFQPGMLQPRGPPQPQGGMQGGFQMPGMVPMMASPGQAFPKL